MLAAGVSARKEYSCREASPSKFDTAHGQPFALRFDINLAVRRCLQGVDQRRAGTIALKAVKFLRRHNDHLIAPMHSHVLRPLAAGTSHQLAEPRLGVLKGPMAWRTWGLF